MTAHRVPKWGVERGQDPGRMESRQRSPYPQTEQAPWWNTASLKQKLPRRLYRDWWTFPRAPREAAKIADENRVVPHRLPVAT